jgi:arginyl-tRNA synthetase
MNFFKDFRDRIVTELEALASAGVLPADLDTRNVNVEPPRDPAHGDLATNAAMVLAKPAGMKPRDIAAPLAERLDMLGDVAAVEVAGPGFVNLRLTNDFWVGMLAEVLKAGDAWGASDIGQGRKVNVEYVSANPTGPLTVGHARGAVVGDALAGVLAKTGFEVCREYYVNDAGNQVDTLARSAYLRYREALGEDIGTIPEGLYPGEYLKDVGAALAARDGGKWLDAPESDWLPEVRRFAIATIMDGVRDDLAALGVAHDVFISEAELVRRGAVEEVMAALQARDLVYTGVLEPPKGKKPEDWEARPQTLFKAARYGDDTDRPIAKSTGAWTYFAVDMANHLDKYRRGHATMVNVWGADHGGYVRRMQAAVKALTEGRGELHIVLCQLVKLLRGGDPVKMSKRAGTFVTLREVVEEVGKDVVRFIMLTRKNDAPLEFDLEKVVEQSKDNPVFYVQYAHARCHSVFRQAREELPDLDLDGEALSGADLRRLTDSDELGLIKLLAAWPRTLEGAAEAYEPHRVAFYLHDVAAAFHGLWTKGKDETTLRFLQPSDPELSAARLALVRAVQQVIAAGLDVMGVTPVEELR